MKINKIFLILSILVSGSILSSCTGAVRTSSWPGVSVVDNAIYIAYATDIFSVNLTDGSINWRYPKEPDNSRHFYATPAIANNQLIVADYQNVLYSLDPNTGNEEWTFTNATGRYIGGVLVIDNVILAPSADNKLYALDINGKLLWEFETNEALWATPVSDGERVFLPSMDHTIYALKLSDGDCLWEIDLEGAMVNSAVLSDDKILYIGTIANEVVAIDAETGKILWRFLTSGAVWSKPTLYNDTLYIGDSNGKIYALNRADGSVLWEIDSGGSIMGSGAINSDGLVFTTMEGDVIAINYAGEKLWSTTIDGTLYNGALVEDDVILIVITKGEKLLVAYNLNGTERWSFIPSE